MNAHEHEIADNRKLWDAWTAIHTTGSFYDVQRFRDNADDVRIAPWERAEVGDVAGKTLLHVQCHFGLDTLSWARLGAGHVTGVDFSEPAIAFADEFAEETRLADRARFVVSNVYDLPGPLAGEMFDIVYTGRGALGWLPDLGPWAHAVAGFGRPGGIFHPRGAPGSLGPRRRAADRRAQARIRLLGRRDADLPRGGVLRRPDRRCRRRGRARTEPFARRDR